MSRRPPPAGAAARPRGIALMLTLVVVILLTAFISEFFFTTGLELRAMQTFKDGARARTLAKLAFKAAQVGLLMPEMEFFAKFRELERALAFTAIPWEEGYLVSLEIVPQDHLFNLNELAGIRDNTAKDLTRWNLFLNILEEVPFIPIDENFEPGPLPQETLAELFAALVDWLDKNNIDYRGASGGLGAEEDAYFDAEPEYRIKNSQLDRLDEIRLVRGVWESRFPWIVWQKYFSALPKSGRTGGLYPEKLNINMATPEEIKAFLENRHFDDLGQLGATEKDFQEKLNAYAETVDDIVKAIIPEEEETRVVFDKKTLEKALRAIPGLESIRIGDKLFAFATEYYRIKLVMNVNEVDTRLQALVRVVRTPAGLGQQVDVLRLAFD